MTLATKRAAQRRGRIGETIACCWLMAQGYRIEARRWRGAGVEIDIVARRGALVLFVEVKARASILAAADALTQHQWRKIARGARQYLSRHDSGVSWRFDAMLLAPRRLPRHIKGAWEE